MPTDGGEVSGRSVLLELREQKSVSVREKQDHIIKMVESGKLSDLLHLNFMNGHGSGGFPPNRFWSAHSEIVGLYNHGKDFNDLKYAYIPHLEFNIGIYRNLNCVPVPNFPNSLFGKYSFFEIVNAARNNDMLYPFDRAKEAMGALKKYNAQTTVVFRLSSTAYGQLISETSFLSSRFEDAILDFLTVIRDRFESVRPLWGFYTHTDSNGKRLWIDQNMQSKKYYARVKKIYKSIFNSAEQVLKKYDLPRRKSYGYGFPHISQIVRGLPYMFFIVLFSFTDRITKAWRSFRGA